MRLVRIVSCSLAFALLAHGAEWVKVRTEHFELFTTAGERKGKEAVAYFEQVRTLFVGLSIKRATSGHPVRIIAFQSEKEFAPYRPNNYASAFYQPAPDQDYIVMRSFAEEDYPLALHEYMHLIVSRSGWKLPVWLNEGIADVYSTLKPTGKKLEIGGMMPGRMQTLQTTKLIPLADLMSVDQRSPLYNERDRAGIFYAESWALTHMLMMTEEYRPKFGIFANALDMGLDPETALERAYDRSLPQMQAALEHYIQGGRFNAGIFDKQLRKASEAPASEPATGLEVGMALAEVQANLGRSADALERYRSLASANPESPLPWIAAGKLELKSGNRDAARQDFAKAVAMNTKDARTYFNYALLLYGVEPQNPAVVSSLVKAIELEPANADAHEFLANRLASQGQFGPALEHLRAIRNPKPDHAHQYFQLLGYVNFRLGNQEEARNAVQRARQTASTPVQTIESDRLLELLNRR